MPVPFQVWQTRKSSLMLPTQPKSRKLMPTFCGTVSDCVISPGLNALITVPSVGAAAERYFTELRLAAPGMFCTMTLGLPGMWRPICRVSTRA